MGARSEGRNYTVCEAISLVVLYIVEKYYFDLALSSVYPEAEGIRSKFTRAICISYDWEITADGFDIRVILHGKCIIRLLLLLYICDYI